MEAKSDIDAQTKKPLIVARSDTDVQQLSCDVPLVRWPYVREVR